MIAVPGSAVALLLIETHRLVAVVLWAAVMAAQIVRSTRRYSRSYP